MSILSKAWKGAKKGAILGPWGMLIGAEVGAVSKDRQRGPSGPPALGDPAANVQDLLGSIRAAGEAKKKAAYRAGLSTAEERGVALGSVPGGVSGMAEQEIQPLVGQAEAETERDIMGTINTERARLEEQRQREMDRQAQRENAKPRGLLASLGL